jgi:hypothetical protein
MDMSPKASSSRTPAASSFVGTSKAAPLPVITIRFSPLWAWLLIGISAAFLLLGIYLAITVRHQSNIPVVISGLAVVGMLGGHYWRHHLHVVARMTPRQLILRRDGVINWGDITTIEKKEISMRYRGANGRSVFICIKLKTPKAAKNKFDAFFNRMKSAITGFDVLVPENELSCTAEWFIAECQKRIAAAAAGNTPQVKTA